MVASDEQAPRGEHYESVPWDVLVDDDARRRRRWLALVGGGIVVAAVAFVVTRAYVDGAGSPVPLPSAAEAVTVPSVAPPRDTTSSTTTSLPSEEDLASTPGPHERDVGAFAAWFVSDFFTVDGADADPGRVRDRLPRGVSVPTAEDGTRSFVESALVLDVEPLDAGRYRATVLVRHLVAADGAAYRRPPPRVAQVTVESGPDGMAVVDLPSPAPLPDSYQAPLDLAEEVHVPAHIAEAAIAEAGAWGAVGDQLHASRLGEAWRVVVEVKDQAGLTLPVVILLDEDGTRL